MCFAQSHTKRKETRNSQPPNTQFHAFSHTLVPLLHLKTYKNNHPLLEILMFKYVLPRPKKKNLHVDFANFSWLQIFYDFLYKNDSLDYFLTPILSFFFLKKKDTMKSTFNLNSTSVEKGLLLSWVPQFLVRNCWPSFKERDKLTYLKWSPEGENRVIVHVPFIWNADLSEGSIAYCKCLMNKNNWAHTLQQWFMLFFFFS